MADEEKKPLNPKKGKKDGKNEDKKESDDESEQQEGGGCTDKYEGICNDGNRFIYSLEELENINKTKEEDSEIAIILRKSDPDFLQPFGIRANPDGLSWLTCFWSIFVPWHADWLVTLLYIIFAIYFWIETLLVMAHQHDFKLKRGCDFDLMFIATLGIAVSLTATATYLVFYSISDNTKKFLDSIDYMGKMIMLFFYTFAFVGSELSGSQMYYAFMFLLVVLLVVNLVLVQYEIGRGISFWTTVAIIAIVYVSDFLFNSSPKEKEVFYIPIFVELAILGAGYLLYIYQVPERFCLGSKFVQLYVTGFIIFTLMLINFIFEAHNILYYSIKLNSGYYNDDSDIDWWKTENIYHK